MRNTKSESSTHQIAVENEHESQNSDQEKVESNQTYHRCFGASLSEDIFMRALQRSQSFVAFAAGNAAIFIPSSHRAADLSAPVENVALFIP